MIFTKTWFGRWSWFSSLCVCVCVCTQSCPTLCNPIHCSLPGSSLCGTLQARILEQFAISFSRGSSWRKDWIYAFCISCISFMVKSIITLFSFGILHKSLPLFVDMLLCNSIFLPMGKIDISLCDSIWYKSLSPRRAYRVRSTYRAQCAYRKSHKGFISTKKAARWAAFFLFHHF